MEFNKTKARIQLLNFIMTGCVSVRYGNEINNHGGFGNNYFAPCDDPQPGDLVSLRSAPFSEWYLSWYVEVELGRDTFCHKHAIESIETGNQCNCSNVSFYMLNREIVKDHPEWKWTDKQFEFKDKWFRSYRKDRDYHTLPVQPQFLENGAVILRTRKKFGMGETTERRFENWKKLLSRDMASFYCESKEVKS